VCHRFCGSAQPVGKFYAAHVPVLVTPPAVQMNARRITLFGTAMWFVAFVVLLPFIPWLRSHDHLVWLWTCVAGWILGLLGWAIMVRHRGMGRTI
jgi:hypothetical protein